MQPSSPLAGLKKPLGTCLKGPEVGLWHTKHQACPRHSPAPSAWPKGFNVLTVYFYYTTPKNVKVTGLTSLWLILSLYISFGAKEIGKGLTFQAGKINF